MPKVNSAQQKVPPVPLASEFIKAVRAYLGLTQGKLAEVLGVGDRSTVAKWETEVDQPSWEPVGRILVKLGVINTAGKDLRLPSREPLDSAPMTVIESQVLEELRKLPEKEQLKVFACAVGLVQKQENNHSQTDATLRKG